MNIILDLHISPGAVSLPEQLATLQSDGFIYLRLRKRAGGAIEDTAVTRTVAKFGHKLIASRFQALFKEDKFCDGILGIYHAEIMASFCTQTAVAQSIRSADLPVTLANRTWALLRLPSTPHEECFGPKDFVNTLMR